MTTSPDWGRTLWITAAWAVCFVLIDWGLRDAPLLWFAALGALGALGAGVVLLALGVAWFTEVRRSRLDTLTTWTFLTPLLGILLAVVVLGERPGGWTAVGLTAVLAAMWTPRWRSTASTPPSQFLPGPTTDPLENLSPT
ncbi:hypothetical protein [Actinotalea ferrariae]|nr:hypothetical protein [Actinotalea ferrariae]